MAAIIEFSLPPEAFALKETLDTHPEAHIEIERVVADDPDRQSGPDLSFSPVARIANRGERTQSPTTDDGDRIHHGRILRSY